MDLLEDAVKINGPDYGFDLPDLYLTTDFTGMVLTQTPKGITMVGYVQFGYRQTPPWQIVELAYMRGYEVDIWEPPPPSPPPPTDSYLNVTVYDADKEWYLEETHQFIVQSIDDKIYLIGVLKDNTIIPATQAEVQCAEELGLLVQQGTMTKSAR